MWIKLGEKYNDGKGRSEEENFPWKVTQMNLMTITSFTASVCQHFYSKHVIISNIFP